MLPKRQSKGPEQGPPKYQPPPSVNSKQYNGAPFNGNKEIIQPSFPQDAKSGSQLDPRKGPPVMNGDRPVVMNGEVKRSGSNNAVQHHPHQNIAMPSNEYNQPPKEDAVRPLSPSRGPLRAAEDNVIIRTTSRLPGEDVRSTWRPLPDEELLQRPPHELLRVIRSAEAEVSRLSGEHVQLVQNARSRLQNSAAELRNTQDLVRRLQDDNQELRDLCCFLDDDRQKGRKLAREWQRFGRYTASVMRQEVSAYQGKLRELDNRQHELIRDNLELKELCLYLDEERGNHASCASCGASLRPGTRDDGDGSSSSTNADEPPIPPASVPNAPNAPAPFIHRSDSRERLMEDSILRQRNAFNDQLVGYIRSLEQRVTQLEEERRTLQQRLLQGPIETSSGPPRPPAVDPAARPEAVVHALQVLQVREQLERALPPNVPPAVPVCLPPVPVAAPLVAADIAMAAATATQADLDDGEKALVREMCNVVWRKLEEAPAAPRR